MADEPKTEDSFREGFDELPELRKKVFVNKLRPPNYAMGINPIALEAYLQKLEDVIRRIL